MVLVNKQNKSILKIKSMKPFGIIRKQPEWVDVIKVKFVQELNPQVSVGQINHPKLIQQSHVIPKRYSSVDSSIHIIPKSYNLREASYKRKSIFEVKNHHDNNQQQKMIKSNVIIQSVLKQSIKMPQDEKKPQNSPSINTQLKNINIGNQNNLQSSAAKSNNQKRRYQIRQDIPVQQIISTSNHNFPNSIVESKLVNQIQPLSNSKLVISNNKANNNSSDMIQHSNPLYKKRPIFSKQNKLHYASLNQENQKQVPIEKQYQSGSKKSRLTLASHLAEWKIQGAQVQPQLIESKITNNLKKNKSQRQSQKSQSLKQSKTAEKFPNYIQHDKVDSNLTNKQVQQQAFIKQNKNKTDKSVIEQQQKNKTQQSIVQRYDLNSKSKQSQLSQLSQFSQAQNPNTNKNEEMIKSIQRSKLSNKSQQVPFKKVIGLKKRKKEENTKLSGANGDIRQLHPQKKQEEALPIHKLKGKSKGIKGISQQSLSQSVRSQSSSTISIEVFKILQMSAIKI